MFEVPFLALLIKSLDRFGFERLVTREHVIDDSGKCVGRGDHGFLRGTARTPGSVKGAKERAGAGTRLSGLSEGLPSAVVDLHDPGAQHLAPRNVVVGRQTEPGTEVLAGGKAGHVGADLSNDGLGQ